MDSIVMFGLTRSTSLISIRSVAHLQIPLSLWTGFTRRWRCPQRSPCNVGAISVTGRSGTMSCL